MDARSPSYAKRADSAAHRAFRVASSSGVSLTPSFRAARLVLGQRDPGFSCGRAGWWVARSAFRRTRAGGKPLEKWRESGLKETPSRAARLLSCSSQNSASNLHPYRYARVSTPCQLTKKEKGVRWQRGVAEMRDSKVGAGPAARGESNAPSAAPPTPSSLIDVAIGGGAVAVGIGASNRKVVRPCRP